MDLLLYYQSCHATVNELAKVGFTDPTEVVVADYHDGSATDE